MDRIRDSEDVRITMGVLEAVQNGSGVSQRQLARELGIALGLVNAYVKRCVHKGLLKISQVPARRYAYFLTPEGFAEKSRLTAEYLTSSFSFFRKARHDCAAVFSQATSRGWRRVALAGSSEVAEIAVLCAIEAGVEIVGIVDPAAERTQFVGRPLLPDFSEIAGEIDGVIVTAIGELDAHLEQALAEFGRQRVLVPALLAVKSRVWSSADA